MIATVAPDRFPLTTDDTVPVKETVVGAGIGVGVGVGVGDGVGLAVIGLSPLQATETASAAAMMRRRRATGSPLLSFLSELAG
jgi:hypothetical protein